MKNNKYCKNTRFQRLFEIVCHKIYLFRGFIIFIEITVFSFLILFLVSLSKPSEKIPLFVLIG